MNKMLVFYLYHAAKVIRNYAAFLQSCGFFS